MAMFLIGIDDTDNESSPGTGQLARRLAEEAVRRGAIHRGITRHQFLLDDRIPYTSHNSGACLALDWPGTEAELRFVADWVGIWSAPGSDPGVCIAAANVVPAAVVEWGWRATRTVLEMEQAMGLADSIGVWLRPLGGSGQGVIGALGSVGLRADGNEGRFLDLPGLRSLGERTDLGALAGIGIDVEHIGGQAGLGSQPPLGGSCGASYLTMGWVRPRLVAGRALWPVTWSDEYDAWVPVDQKRSRPLE